MKRVVLILIAMGVVLPAVAVTSYLINHDDSYVGIYHIDKGTDSYNLTIRDDGTYLLDVEYHRVMPSKFTDKGSYVIRNDSIELTNSLGGTDILTHDGINLSSRSGGLWIKQ